MLSIEHEHCVNVDTRAAFDELAVMKTRTARASQALVTPLAPALSSTLISAQVVSGISATWPLDSGLRVRMVTDEKLSPGAE